MSTASSSLIDASSSYLIDASAAIAMWEEMYPPENFPTFYALMGQKFLALNIYFVKPVFDEIEKTQGKLGDDDLIAWLKKTLGEKSFINTLNQGTSERVNEYTVTYLGEGGAKREGVDLNDLLLVATAKEYGFTIVTQEGIQSSPPKKKEKYKIPAVCQKEEVRCINLIEFIKEIKLVV